MNFLSSGLFKRFILAMAALALLPSIFMGFQLLRISRKGMQDSVLELHTKLAEKTAQGVVQYVAALDDKLRFTISALQRQDISWPVRQEFLRSLVESHTDIEEVSVLLRDGRELLKVYNPKLSGGTETAPPDPEGYRQFAKKKQRTIWVDAAPGKVPRLQVYYPLSPVTDIRISVALNKLAQSIAEERIGGSGFLTLIRHNGEPLLYPPDLLLEADRKDFSQRPIVIAALGAVSVGSSEFSLPDGRAMVGAYAPVPELAGAVLTQQAKDDAYLSSPAYAEMKRTALWIIVFLSLAAVAIAFTLARNLTKPLLLITRAAEQMARGEFPEGIVLRTGDELQDLADTFNRMTARLKSYAKIQVDRLILEQKKTEAILFSIGDGILMVDNDGVIQLANRKAKEFLGQGEAAIEGKPLAEVLPQDSPLSEATLDVVAKPQEDIVKEVDLSTEDKRLFLRLSAKPLLSPGTGMRLGVVCALHDVSLEKELDKMKEEFLQSITHDLRNPVGSILGFLDFMRKGVVGVLNAQQISMVESMHKSATRLLALVNNILDLAKMESGRLEVDLKPASLAGICSQAIDILSGVAQRRGIRMELQAEEEFTLALDSNQMARVIQNLLGNAVKFSPDDGKIVMAIEDKGDHLLFSVVDEGPGIPSSHLELIFGKFEQVPGQKRGGTGLGLTIGRSFVEAHLGKIWVESELGKGAKFFFTLPKGLGKNEAGEVCVLAPVEKSA